MAYPSPSRQERQQEIAAKLAQEYIKALKEDRLPWSRGFDPVLNAPHNPSSGTIYAGASKLILMFQAEKHDYQDPRWLTFKQAQQLGGNVRKGEHATHCIRWQPLEIQDKDKKGKPLLDSEGNEIKHKILIPCPYAVFNVKQIDGLQLPPLIKTEHQWEPHERAEKLILNSGAKIVELRPNQQQTPCYCYSNDGIDEIRMPKREQFHDAGNYYGVLLHELSHWTGHPSRMNRIKDDINTAFGTQEYAREELRAEISSSLLCSTIGVPHDLGNHKAYVQSWAERLEKDPKEILYAASAADKIVTYLRQFDPVKDKPLVPMLNYNRNEVAPHELSTIKQQALSGIKDRVNAALNDHETIKQQAAPYHFKPAHMER